MPFSQPFKNKKRCKNKKSLKTQKHAVNKKNVKNVFTARRHACSTETANVVSRKQRHTLYRVPPKNALSLTSYILAKTLTYLKNSFTARKAMKFAIKRI